MRPDSVRRDTDEYLDRQDHFNNWREEYTELHPGTTVGESSAKLFASWKGYAERRNFRVGKESELIEKLVKRCGCRPTNHFRITDKGAGVREVRGVEGIRLLIDPADEYARSQVPF
jgi:hypothetical protein